VPECYGMECDRTEGVELYDLHQPKAQYQNKQKRKPICPTHVAVVKGWGYEIEKSVPQ
jgi:hypothetical protein